MIDLLPLLAQTDLTQLMAVLSSPLLWAVLLGAVGVWLLLPAVNSPAPVAAHILAAISLASLVACLTPQFDVENFTSGTGMILGVAAVGAFLSAGLFLSSRKTLAAFLWVGLATTCAIIQVATMYVSPILAIGVFGSALASCALLLPLGNPRQFHPLALTVGVLFGGVGALLALRFDSWRKRDSILGAVAALAGLFFLAATVAPTDTTRTGFWAFFYLLAGVTALSAVATISMRSPVYSAMWFALTLLATSGLFLMHGAQFLSVATIAVYAGAILVTFLFVLMLAQPEGHAFYDRISWGAGPTLMSVLAAAIIVGGLSLTYARFGDDANLHAAETPEVAAARNLEINHSDHMARLGGYLFTRHIVAIEAAGSLLLAALVGAIAIVIKGREGSGPDVVRQPTPAPAQPTPAPAQPTPDETASEPEAQPEPESSEERSDEDSSKEKSAGAVASKDDNIEFKPEDESDKEGSS